MGDKYKQCPRGHYYKGGTCPYCKTEIFSVGSCKTKSDTLHTSVCPPHHLLTTDSGTRIVNMPFCTCCGKPIRKSIPHPDFPIIGSIQGHAYDGNVPWNYRWNGRCENCGQDFSISMHQKIHTQEKDRYTSVRVSARWVERDTSDDLIGISGVEIEQRNSIDGVKRTFVSTNELKYLINALKNSPLLEQLDWNEDRT